jgi:hypothetical protein
MMRLFAPLGGPLGNFLLVRDSLAGLSTSANVGNGY